MFPVSWRGWVWRSRSHGCLCQFAGSRIPTWSLQRKYGHRTVILHVARQVLYLLPWAIRLWMSSSPRLPQNREHPLSKKGTQLLKLMAGNKEKENGVTILICGVELGNLGWLCTSVTQMWERRDRGRREEQNARRPQSYKKKTKKTFYFDEWFCLSRTAYVLLRHTYLNIKPLYTSLNSNKYFGFLMKHNLQWDMCAACGFKNPVLGLSRCLFISAAELGRLKLSKALAGPKLECASLIWSCHNIRHSRVNSKPSRRPLPFEWLS